MKQALNMKCVDIVGRANGYQKVNYEAARDIWAVSSVFKKLQKADKVFNLHAPDAWEPWVPFTKKIVTIKHYDSLPWTEVIPTEKLIKKYGYIFHSSISWIVAYAVHLGYKDIGFHGIHMQHHTEYGKQRDSLFLLFGMLLSKGIKLTIPEDSGIYISTKLYGGI
jgi:hypothetical protein